MFMILREKSKKQGNKIFWQEKCKDFFANRTQSKNIDKTKYILLKTNNERTTTVRTKYRNAIFWQEKCKELPKVQKLCNNFLHKQKSIETLQRPKERINKNL